MTRISRDEVLMNEAENRARRSTCNRLQVGAVISRDGRTISSGYNGPVAGAPHCSEEFCDIERSCTRSVHAEANAIAFAAREGTAIKGCTIHTIYSPCPNCADLIINSGIREVVFREFFRDRSGVEKLLESGVVVNKLDSNNIPIPVEWIKE